MSDTPALSLADGQRLLRLSDTELWYGYLAIGGTNEPEQLRRHVHARHCPDPADHDIIAQALNDAFVEAGHPHTATYTHPDQPLVRSDSTADPEQSSEVDDGG